MAKLELGQISGLREAREAMQELERRVRNRVGKKALKNGPAPVFVASIKSKARVSSRASDPTPGSMRDAVKAVNSRMERGRPTVAIIADDMAAVPNEFGLHHRNYPASPFFRPGIDAVRAEAGEAMAGALKSEMDEAVAAAAAKGAKG
jgi:hypothetical protein